MASGIINNVLPRTRQTGALNLTTSIVNTYAEAPISESPESVLWLRVLLDAIKTALDPSDEEQEYQADDHYWLFVDFSDDVGSYWWICEQLAIDGTRLRNRLRESRSDLTLKGNRSAYHARHCRLAN